MNIDARTFRNALGSIPTGVAVITAQAQGDRAIGITINSFTSVSLVPPLVLWCLDRTSERFSTFVKCSGFVVSILDRSQDAVSSRLAKRGSQCLEGIDLMSTELGPPALNNAIAVFECERHAIFDAGDHVILVGQVVRFTKHDPGEPLVFFRGKYGSIAQVTVD